MFINDFSYECKTRIEFGVGNLSKAGEFAKELGGTKAMIAADRGVRSTGIVDKVEAAVKEAGLDVVHFDQIVPNPRQTDCEAGAKLALDAGADIILAVGGGSTMDSSKAIAGMIGHKTVDFDDIKYPKEYTCDPIPLIAIPTTAGTGSEVSIFGVINNEKIHKKEYCFDVRCGAAIALMDPEVLMGIPRKIAASTGMDALAHAVGGYVVTCRNPVSQAYGLYATKLIAENLRKFCYDRDIESAKAMMMGSLLAGLSFGFTDTAADHAIGEVLGALYDCPHGEACAMFLPKVMERNIPAYEDGYVDIARAMGVVGADMSKREIAQAGIEAVKKMAADLQIPKFSEIKGLKIEDFEDIGTRCAEHLSNGDNPIVFTAEEWVGMCKELYAEETAK